MNRKSRLTIGITRVWLSVLGGLAISAQVKYTVRVPGELAFSEFRGYEAWQSISINRNDRVIAVNRYEGIVDTRLIDLKSRVWCHAVEEEVSMTPAIVAERPIEQTTDKPAIRPFHVEVPEAELIELRRRINATRWPDRETVTDASQGVQLATTQALARYWATEYDWRKCEARLNALPQFITEIDGLDIHFIHVRSKHDHALPLIVTHGWPGSVVEQMKIIDPLTNPTAHGGTASDAFDVVIPSMPGYGYSGKPTETGWGPDRIARAWDVLMKRLGYTSYVAQGGDWGAVVVDLMGVQAPKGLLGIHTNMPGIFPAAIDAAAFSGAPMPSGLSDDEKVAYERVQFVYQKPFCDNSHRDAGFDDSSKALGGG